MMEPIARAIADTRDAMYDALQASQRNDWRATADALERATDLLRDALALIEEQKAA